MPVISKQIMKPVIVFFLSILAISCVTETVESPSVKFDEVAVVSVGDPKVSVVAGSSFAWLPEAVHFYEDKRLASAPIKSLIESEIVKNIEQQKMLLVTPPTSADYAMAYTAALESSLDDSAIIRRFGLLPGIAKVPQDDVNVEKGSLIIYIYNNKSGDIIWRSAAQVGVEFDMPMEQRKERVVRIVAEMFQTFPVKR